MDQKFSEFRMNWVQFKDPLCYLCLAGAVVASWSLTQEIADSNNLFNIKHFCH